MRYIAWAAASALIRSGLAFVERKIASLDGSGWDLGVWTRSRCRADY